MQRRNRLDGIILWRGYGPFTVDQARDVAKDAKRSAEKGADPQHEKKTRRDAPTIADLIQLYLTEGRIDKPSKRDSSWATDERDLRCHVKALVGNRAPHVVNRTDIARWQADVRDYKTARVEKMGFRRKSVVECGPKIATGATRTLAAMFNWAIKRELIEKNPAAGVETMPVGIDRVR